MASNARKRPAHLTAENAARFQHQSVVDRYHLRLPYPPELFDLLGGLIVDEPRAVLDVGTGTGDLARPLATLAARVDALDISTVMLERGRSLPGGDAPNLRWIVGPAETAPLDPPYALISAGESLHWMDWEVALPRFHRALTPNGVLAIVYRHELPTAWEEELNALIRRHSTAKNFEPFNVIAELEARRLFEKRGAQKLVAGSVQSIDDYVQSFHSRATLSRDAMAEGAADAFDHELTELIQPWSEAGKIQLQMEVLVTWGRPHEGNAPA
jgi:SAM-dependent methyltransferase